MRILQIRFFKKVDYASAERIWTTRNEAQPNGEGVASGGVRKFLFPSLASKQKSDIISKNNIEYE